jgi:hypothetical protein
MAPARRFASLAQDTMRILTTALTRHEETFR